MVSKEQIIETVRALPKDYKMDDLFERLVFMEKVQEGLSAVEEGRVISLNEAKARLGIS